MRSKVIIAAVVVPILLVVALVVLHQQKPPSTDGQISGGQAPPSGQTNAPALVVTETAQPKSEASSDSPETKHQQYVDARSEELMDLAMNDDPASLDTILSELTNRDPEIRKAAVEAAKQFGSRDAIPKLTQAEAQTDDLKEKVALTKAIDFLKLPSLSEVAVQSPNPKTGGANLPRKKTVLPPRTRPLGAPAPAPAAPSEANPGSSAPQ